MTRAADIDWLSFEEILQLLLKQAIAADIEMQLQQGLAWKQVSAPLHVQGIDVAEGLDQFRPLGITELRLTFWLEPRRPGRCARMWRALRHLLAAPRTPPLTRYRLVAANTGTAAMCITITVARGADGEWRITTEPADGAALAQAGVPRALTG